MQTVVDGILTHYEILGHGKQHLLILHGWKRSLTEWLPVASQLGDQYKVILLDLPGFGQTPRPEKTLSIYDYAEFVKHFLGKLEIKKTTLLGHSFGGRIGIILGAKTDLLNALILVDSAAIEKKNTLVTFQIAINKVLVFPIKLLSPSRVAI